MRPSITAFDAVGDLDQLARGGIGVGEEAAPDEFHAAARSSLFSPRITILSASSGRGRCSAFKTRRRRLDNQEREDHHNNQHPEDVQPPVLAELALQKVLAGKQKLAPPAHAYGADAA